MNNGIKIKYIKALGCLASLLSLFLWVILVSTDPLFEGMNKVNPGILFLMIVLPAILFLIGLWQSRVILLVVSFLWSIPYSIFMLFSSRMFAVLSVSNVIYFICIISLRKKGARYW